MIYLVRSIEASFNQKSRLNLVYSLLNHDAARSIALHQFLPVYLAASLSYHSAGTLLRSRTLLLIIKKQDPYSFIILPTP